VELGLILLLFRAIHEPDRDGTDSVLEEIPVHAILGRLGVTMALVSHKGHATGLPGELVAQHIHVQDGPVPGEEFAHLLLVHVRRQVRHIQVGDPDLIIGGTGVGHLQAPAAHLVAIQADLGSRRLAGGHELHEPIAAPARSGIADDLVLADLPVLGEHLSQLRLHQVPRQVVDNEVREATSSSTSGELIHGGLHLAPGLERSAVGVTPSQRLVGGPRYPV